MQTLTESVFRLAPPGGLFDETAIRNLFGDVSEGARKLLVHRAFKKGEINRLRPGLYVLAEEFRKSPLHPFTVAAALHSPSHVSLESALSYHGLIPEAVYQVSSVTAARSRTFRSSLGVFSYDRVPADFPRAGVQAIKLEGDFWAFVATPLRAVADLVYLKRGITWENDGARFLTQSMRIEDDDLAAVPFGPSDAICASLRDRRVREYLIGLKEEFGQ